MKIKTELTNPPIPGFVEGIRDFLKLLEDMERKKEKVRNGSGEFKGPFDSKAAYGYVVKLGIDKNDMQNSRPYPNGHLCSTRQCEEGVQKRGIKVFDEDDTVSVVAYLPHIREGDIEFEIAGNHLLKITAITPDGNLVRNIRVSEEKNIKGINEASFKNGILTIKLGKMKMR
jgi:HSP20 family molecular chaperone IbpA